MLMPRFDTALLPQPGKLPKPTVNLALSGSGSHGAFGWGILDKLLEDGRFAIEGIAASGTDAMNAVVFAFGDMQGGPDEARSRLEALWRGISGAGGSRSRLPGDRPLQTSDPAWMRGPDLLESLVDFGALRHCRNSNLCIQATSAQSGQLRIFNSRQITVEAVLASACLPQLSPPVSLDDGFYWDGRYCGLPAARQLLMSGTSLDLLVGQVSAIGVRPTAKDIAEIEIRAAEMALSHLLETDILALPQAIGRFDGRWFSPDRGRNSDELRVHHIRSTDVISDLTPASRLDTSWPMLLRLRDMGRLAAEIWLNSGCHRAFAGTRPC